MFSYEKVLVVVAHPDDELGCAGTIAKFVEEGADVKVVHAHIPDLDVHGNKMGQENTRLLEMDLALEHLGVHFSSIYSLNLDEDDFVWSQRYVKILDAKIKSLYGGGYPNLIITQRRSDTQQSHAHLSNIIGTVCRKNITSLWEMDEPVPGGVEPDALRPNLFVDISKQYPKKILAIAAYQSQHDRYNGAILSGLPHRDAYYGNLIDVGGDDRTLRYESFRIRKEIW